MKKISLCAGLVAGLGTLAGTTAKAQLTFTSGDIVVYRVGDGSAALTNAGSAVFLDEYNPSTGTLDGTMALSTLATPLVASGTATSEGLLNLSTNGQYLLATGYDAAVGTAAVGKTASSTTFREVATINPSGAVAQTTINSYTGNNIRSATSVDGTTIYTAGVNATGSSGILSVTSGAAGTAGTMVGTTTPVANARAVSIYGGQIYFTNSVTTPSAAGNVYTLGSATAPSATPTTVINSAASTSPYSIVATALTLNGTAADTIYVADSSAGIEKFSLVGGSFTLTGTVALAGVTGLIGITTGTTEKLFATSPTGIYTLTDSTGQGGTLTGTPALLVAPATNEAFRGVAFAPSLAAPAPEPSTWVTLALGGFGLFAWMRRRRPAVVRA